MQEEREGWHAHFGSHTVGKAYPDYSPRYDKRADLLSIAVPSTSVLTAAWQVTATVEHTICDSLLGMGARLSLNRIRSNVLRGWNGRARWDVPGAGGDVFVIDRGRLWIWRPWTRDG